MAINYGPTQRHAMLDNIFELLGVNDTTPYMLAPGSPQYQQAEQQQRQAKEIEKKKADKVFETQLGGQQAQITSLQSGDKRAWEEFEWKRTNDMVDNLRDDSRLDWDVERGRAELVLEEDQERNVSLGG